MNADRRAVVAAVVLAAAVTVAVALPGVWVRATYGAQLSADEPHYLITAISLAEDGDLDVSDELADERWRDFHEAGLPVQELELPDGRMLAPHDPLLPALLALPWRVGGWVGAKLMLVALAGALAGLSTWVAIRRFTVRPVVAAAVVGALGASWPLSGYASQIYPELPAALVTVAATAVVTGRPSRRAAVVLTLLVSALPWLAVKYVPVAAAVTAVAAVRWWRRSRRGLAVGLCGALAASGLAYLVAHQVWYGGWTVYAAGDHFAQRGEFAVVGFSPNYIGRSRRLIGLLVDRDFGLVAWQPLWLLTVPAAAAWIRRRVDGWDVVVWPLVAGWLTATFVALTMQGWWVPGRQVVVVLPLAALLVAWWLDGRARGAATGCRADRAWLGTAAGLGVLGVVSAVWVTVDGLRGELAWIVDFASVGDPLYQLRRVLLPDYLRVTWTTWARQTAWLVVAAGMAAAAWRGAGAQASNEPISDGSMPRSS